MAHVALDVDPVHAKEHYERVLAQNPDSILAYESQFDSVHAWVNADAIKYGESYLVHEQDEAYTEFFLAKRPARRGRCSGVGLPEKRCRYDPMTVELLPPWPIPRLSAKTPQRFST